ncbi:MAG TPA: hypothetical protein VHH32_09815 [Gemmatimonadales bacterium]|nr:hypothetical protein [Gemmatimonadales bacterium]
MHLMMLLALMQAPGRPDSGQFAILYEKSLNDTLTLSLAVAQHHANNGLHSQLRVGLTDRRKPRETRVIALIRDQGLDSYKVIRTDDSTIVIGRLGFYESRESLKLFLDPRTKSVIKQIDYPPDIGLKAVDDREVATILEIPDEIVQRLEEEPWDRHPLSEDSTYPVPDLRNHPMPKSTFAEFARARPDMVENGFDESHTTLDERAGPYQVVGSRIWFGKAFYDGEGVTGVGGLGYFDTGTLRYTFVPVSGIADWSVSAILIEEGAAWMGLVRYPEGEPYGGGLLRYDFRSRTTQKYPTEELVYQIVRWKDRLYVATKNGAYLVQDNRLVKRYRVEPDIDNRFIIVTEAL